MGADFSEGAYWGGVLRDVEEHVVVLLLQTIA